VKANVGSVDRVGQVASGVALLSGVFLLDGSAR
jgi:hypothetical protein